MTIDLKASLEQAIRERFADSQIDAVYIEEDFDADGDKVFKVTIVYAKSIDVGKAKGLARRMRSALEDAGNSAFPVIAFRSLADQKRLKAAAA